MKHLAALVLFVTTFLFADQVVAEVLCLLTGQEVSGFNRICYYQCPGSKAAITVRSTELCPLSIRR